MTGYMAIILCLNIAFLAINGTSLAAGRGGDLQELGVVASLFAIAVIILGAVFGEGVKS